MNKTAKILLNISTVIAIILAIISFFVPILLGGYLVIGIGILCGIMGAFGEKRILGIVAIILSLISLFISPTIWLAIIGNNTNNKQIKSENIQNTSSSGQKEVGVLNENESLQNSFTNEKECPENYDNNSVVVPEGAKTINEAMSIMAITNMPKYDDFCSISNTWTIIDENNFQKYSDDQYKEALTMAEKKLESIISYRKFIQRAYKELPQKFPNATPTEIGYAKKVLDANLNAVGYQSNALGILKDRNNMYIKYRNDLSKKQGRVYSDFQLLNKQYSEALMMQASQRSNIILYNGNN